MGGAMPRRIGLQRSQFRAVGQKCLNKAQVLRVEIDQDIGANQIRSLAQYRTGVTGPIKIDVRPYATLLVAPDRASVGWLHHE